MTKFSLKLLFSLGAERAHLTPKQEAALSSVEQYIFYSAMAVCILTVGAIVCHLIHLIK